MNKCTLYIGYGHLYKTKHASCMAVKFCENQHISGLEMYFLIKENLLLTKQLSNMVCEWPLT